MTKKAKAFKLFDSKAFWAAVSLLASVIIWNYVTGTQQTEINRTFNAVEVTFIGGETLRENESLVVTELLSESVTLRISGARSNIGKLDDSDIKAVVDLSKVAKEGVNKAVPTFSYPAEVDESEIIMTSTTPEYIEFTVEKVTKKPVAVRGSFIGSVSPGYVAGEPECSPENVTVYGPSSVLDKISYAWATIGGEQVDRTRTASVAFTLMDENGNEIKSEAVTCDVDTISITLPISATKEVPLTVTLIDGAGALGENCIVTVVPDTITISGDTTIVAGINKISLATIDLTDFASTFEDTFPITLDNEIENLTGVTEATVRIEIPGLETKKLTVASIDYTNVPAGMTAAVITRSLEVTIRASAEVLKSIKSDNIRAVADLTDIRATGDVSVPVKIRIDGYTDAGAIGDYMITVNLKG